jgi:hypothetical protein
MNTKQKILSKLYGKDYLEYMRLDDLLFLFDEDEFKDKTLFDKNFSAVDRAIDKLVRDGYVKEYDRSYRITSEGLLFRGSGGYTKELLISKRSSIGFWTSIVSFIIACASFVISVLK